MIKPQHVKLLAVILNKMTYFENNYLTMGNEGFQDAYNQSTGLGISIRTIYYYQARLKEFNMILKKPRRWPATKSGSRWQSSMTELLPKGMIILKKAGFDVFKIINEITRLKRLRKKESSRESTREDSKSSMRSIAEVISKSMESIKPE